MNRSPNKEGIGSRFEYEIDKPWGGLNGVFSDWRHSMEDSLYREEMRTRYAINPLEAFFDFEGKKALKEEIYTRVCRRLEFILRKNQITVEYREWGDWLVACGETFLEAKNKMQQAVSDINSALESACSHHRMMFDDPFIQITAGNSSRYSVGLPPR